MKTNFSLKNSLDFFGCFLLRYARALGAFYMRLVGTSIECYKYLEPLYNDYRKLKRRGIDGGMSVGT